jgi:uncharacterized protein
MNTLTKVEILSRLRSAKESLRKKYPLESIALFGSYARGEETKGSDIDLLVEFNGPIGLEIVDLVEDLEKTLAGTKVELVSKRAIKERYKPYILKDLIYV